MGRFTPVKVEKPSAVNAWAEDVAELNAAIEADENFDGGAFTVDAKTEGKDLRAIRDAAKALNKTVRIIKRDDSAVEVESVKDNGRKVYKGTVALTVMLVDKYADGRGRKPAAPATDSEETVAAKTRTK